MTFIDTYTTKFTGAFFTRSKVLLAIAGILLLSVLIACAPLEDGDGGGGGSDDTYTVGGTVTGHTGEVSLNLTYGEKTETLEVESGTDKFTFDAKLVANQSFTIAVTNPAGQSCRSSLTEGSIVDANVTNVEVTCIPIYSVSGTVSGLANDETITLTLFSTGGIADDIVITGDDDETANDTFTFDTKLVADTTYTVTTTSPAHKSCTVAPAGSQTIGDADVTDVVVTCIIIYSVGGQVSGAADYSQITITLLHVSPPTSIPTNIVTIDVTPSADGRYDFTGIPKDKNYLIVVDSDTANEVCTPRYTTFRVSLLNRTEVPINCSIATGTTYSVGGTISGLASGETIVLTLSPTSGNVENKIITADAATTTADTFAFDTKLANGDTYTVTATTQPTDNTCTVDSEGEQTMGTANVNIAVTCEISYSISGSVTGATLASDVYVILTLYDDNAGTGASKQSHRVGSTLTFTITGIPENKFYTLQATSSIAGETCSATPTTPTLVIADVTDAMVSCTASTGPVIRINLASFSDEASLTTVNVFIGDGAIPATTGNPPPTPTRVVNGSDTDVLIIPNIDSFNADGFRYDIPIDAGQYYAVTVDTTSGTESCEIRSNGTGGPITDSLTVGIRCR